MSNRTEPRKRTTRRRSRNRGRIGRCVVMLLVVLLTAGCSSRVDSTGDGWSVGEDGGDGLAADADMETGTDDGEIVCGEPDQVIETVEAAVELAPCDVYLGSFELNFNESQARNLEMFPDLRVIEGTFAIEGGGYLRSFEGLDRLERVGALRIEGFAHLEDYSGLSELRRVDGKCKISWTNSKDLTGLENLRSTGDLQLVAMLDLDSLDGLAGLERVRGDFWVESEGDLSRDEVEAFLERVQVDGEANMTLQ